MLCQQSGSPDTTPLRLIDPSVFQGFIHAGPLAAEGSRQGQLGQRPGCCLTSQRIRQFEERIRAPLKTAINLMTNVIPCVKVEARKGPLLVFFCCKVFYVIWQFLAIQRLPVAFGSLNTNQEKKIRFC
jgi:hypothetical protein